MHQDQTVVSPPSYQLPPVVKKPKKWKWVLLVVAVIVLVLATAAAAYFFTPLGAYVNLHIAKMSIPAELKSATFLSDHDAGKTVAYKFGTGSNAPTEQVAGTLVSESIDSTGSARITRAADGMYSVLIDGTSVLQDHTPRIGVGRSPDGTRIVFAQVIKAQMLGPSSSAVVPLDRKNWNVIVYDKTTHTTFNLGIGVSPFFIDQTHVGWIAPAGLAVTDLVSGKSEVLTKDMGGRVQTTVLVSPNHSVVAWYGSANTLIAYKMTATTATALPVSTVPSPLWSLMLSNDGIYEIRNAGVNTEILKQPFGGAAVHIGSIPATYTINRLLLGTI